MQAMILTARTLPTPLIAQRDLCAGRGFASVQTE